MRNNFIEGDFIEVIACPVCKSDMKIKGRDYSPLIYNCNNKHRILVYEDLIVLQELSDYYGRLLWQIIKLNDTFFYNYNGMPLIKPTFIPVDENIKFKLKKLAMLL